MLRRIPRLKCAVGVSLFFAVLLPQTAAADPLPDNTELKRQFQLADRDGDGKLSRSEAQQSGWLANQMQRFEDIDRDHSGTITLVEITQAVARQVKNWMSADTDHDGRVTEEEARRRPGLSKMFGQADANGDGVLTADELEHFSERSYYSHTELPSVAPNIIEKRF